MRYLYIYITILLFVLLAALLLLTGCVNPFESGNPQFENPPAFGPEWLDSMIEVAKAFSLVNAASTPINPYVMPITVGLAGLTTVLEALRRKEKSARKHAEQKLNGSDKPK